MSIAAKVKPSAGAAMPAVHVVVIAKAAMPGRVKTRLTRPAADPCDPALAFAAAAALSDGEASRVHAALCRCWLTRVQQWMPEAALVLAYDDGSPAPAADAAAAQPTTLPNVGLNQVLRRLQISEVPEPATADGAGAGRAWRLLQQGPGDLGERLRRIWSQLGGGPVVFFGVDCPDVPAGAMREILPRLGDEAADAWIGPVGDGGYWTLACRRWMPELLTGIDWGGPAVYDQTHAAAARVGLRLRDLPAWHDVDHPADLTALLDRLDTAAEPALLALRDELRLIIGR